MAKSKNPPFYWMNNVDRIVDAASLCKSRKEFQYKFKGAYSASLKLGIHDQVCSHMIQGCLLKEDRCIYAIEFPNKTIYVGLTNDYEKRQRQHIRSKKGIVNKYQSNNQYRFILLEDYMESHIAQEREGYWYNHYKNLGYTVLNNFPTGGLGGRYRLHTLESCRIDASIYKTRWEYRQKNRSSYEIARSQKWLDEICKHMTSRMHQWTYDEVLNIALKYDAIWKFGEIHRAPYEWARRYGYLKKIKLILKKEKNVRKEKI